MHKASVSLIALSASLLIPLAAGVFLYHSINHTSQLDCQNVQENLVTQMLNLERGFSEELAQIAVQRASLLVRRQMEFVAGISHELRTLKRADGLWKKTWALGYRR